MLIKSIILSLIGLTLSIYAYSIEQKIKNFTGQEANEMRGKDPDHATRDLLEKILVSEEEHADWIETQLHIIKDIGMENYLAQQIKEA